MRNIFDPKNLPSQDLAGQRLMVGFDGTHANSQLRETIEKFRVGGLILFARNCDNPDQIKNLVSDAQSIARESGLPPLFIAIDQEGGVVKRLGPPFTQFPGNPFINNEKDARDFARACARELSGVGFTMNMAPVLDVPPETGESIMEKRAFSRNPGLVSLLGCTIIEDLQKRGILSVAKHFPGIGSTIIDSHLDLPTCHATKMALETRDLQPFSAAIKARVSGIMLSHIMFPAIDARWPASLSVVIAHDLLRKQMGFSGLVLTDDLDMGAIIKHFSIKTAATRVLDADIDQALICHPSPAIAKAHEILTAGIQDSAKMRKRAMASYLRILEAKRQNNAFTKIQVS